MKKHNVFLLFTSLTALLFCACSSELKEKENASSKPGTVTLSIANDTQRTISPAAGISYKDVREWTVTFKDITESRSEKYNDIVKTVSFSESANQQIQLPLGTYAVIFKGDVTKQVTTGNETSEASTEPQTVPFYGESTVTVEDGKSASISVFVAPKKSNGGTGSFNFTVTTSGEFGNYTPVVSGNYFTVSLTPYGGKNPVATWTPTEISHSASVTEAGSTYSFSVSSETLESVPSGFYTLSIKYTWVVGEDSVGQLLTKTKEIYSPYHDFLVEIVDGLTTSGSADITVSLDDSKTYYATTDKNKASGNGSFRSMPVYFDDVLTAINKTTISTANIYMVDEIDPQNPSYPEIDVSKVNEAEKTYNIYTISNEAIPCYIIQGAGEGANPTIDIGSSVPTVTLKNTSSSSSGVANIVVAGRPNFVLENNTSIIIDLTDSQQILATTIYMPDSTYNKYYAEHPCVTVKEASSTSTTNFSVYTEDSLSNSHIVVTDSSDDGNYKTTNFYIIPSENASLGVTGIPAYTLSVKRDGVDVTKSTLLYAGDTVVITATPADGAFLAGTSFKWFVNGKQVEANKDDPKSCSIRIGVTGDSGVNNSIICLAGYNGEYATVQTTLTAAEQTALLYTKRGLGYSALEYLNNTSSVTEVINFTGSYTISDFCIDTKTNDAYIIYADGNGNTYIEKATYYHAMTDMHYASADYSCSEPNLIRMGNDNKLYVKFSSISDGLVFGIVDLLPNATGTQGEASTSQYLTMNEVSSTDQIMSFCVDDAGIMYITYKDSESNILLGKFSITEGVLTKQNSITLATISSTDKTATSTYFNGISSALKVTDMHYEDGYIYLIVRDVIIDYTTPTDSVRSLGGVCKIKAEDLTLADSTNPLIGWANTLLVITKNESGENVYNYKHNEETQNYFYGPHKIIAIKPKEIVIADDGASIENSNMHQENRVVLFNLETNSITGVKTSPKEFYFSTSGGDTMNYKPN